MQKHGYQINLDWREDNYGKFFGDIIVPDSYICDIHAQWPRDLWQTNKISSYQDIYVETRSEYCWTDYTSSIIDDYIQIILLNENHSHL